MKKQIIKGYLRTIAKKHSIQKILNVCYLNNFFFIKIGCANIWMEEREEGTKVFLNKYLILGIKRVDRKTEYTQK